MRVVAQQRHLSVVAGSSLTEKIAVFVPLPSARGTMATGGEGRRFRRRAEGVFQIGNHDAYGRQPSWRSGLARFQPASSRAGLLRKRIPAQQTGKMSVFSLPLLVD